MRDSSPRRSWLHVLAVAAALSALNVAKPAHIDDPPYLRYATEFAAHPLDPYAFQIGSPAARSANELLVPPVLPYWLAAGITLFGPNLVLLKLTLVPFAVLLAAAVLSILKRVAPDHAVPLLWLIVFSPVLVPSFNLMLEVPVLALGLGAVAVALRSVEHSSWPGFALGGLLAGLAVQTKYNGAVAGAAAVAWCVLNRRFAGAFVVMAVAAGIAVGWEAFVAHQQGQSHFLIHFGQRKGNTGMRFVHLVLPLLSHVAGLAPVIALLALRALAANRFAWLLGATVPLGVLVFAVFPSQDALLRTDNGKPLLTLSNLVYGTWILLVWPALLAGLWGLGQSRESGDRLTLFLLLWVVLEVGGYFALSPFPAARRVAGVVVVLSLAVGRLAHTRRLAPKVVKHLAIAGSMYSLLFAATDGLDAAAERQAALIIAQHDRERLEPGTLWSLSWHGFEHTMEQQGARPLSLNLDRPKVGDRIVSEDMSDLTNFLRTQPWLELDEIEVLEMTDRFPLRVCPSFYSGSTPLESRRGPRIRYRVYRVTAVRY